jgi:hypothetical protein
MIVSAFPMRRVWVALCLAVSLVAALPSRAAAAPDAREIQAREDFAAGRYQKALDIFARLYAETLHPNYLRNIGRCYQNLGEPDRAISSFRDYERKAKALSSEERAEIDGYIREMQELKRQRESGAAQPAGEPALAPKLVTAPPPEAQPPQAAKQATTQPQATALDLTARNALPEPDRVEEPAIYERWWFWAIVAGAVGAGVGVAVATGAFSHTNDAPCLSGFKCGQ